MSRLVMKFGGTSVADIPRIRNVARHVKREVDAGHQVAVVVSAMAGTTNQLVAWTREASPLHDAREYDSVVSAGEQITSGLLAIALQDIGVNARSWQGWQIPLKTDGAHGAARIVEIDSEEILRRLANGQVAVVAGFQGVAPDNRIATLGRGGSDTSAVALAAALDAARCDIYTDVDGVYTADPRIVQKAQRLARVSYEEMLEMASVGAKVLQVRSVELAMVHGVRTFVRSSFADPDTPEFAGGNSAPGTLICDEDEIVEKKVVSGIAYSKDEAQISLRRVADKPGVAAAVFGPLAAANVNVDMIVQNVSEAGQTDISFTVPTTDLGRAEPILAATAEAVGARGFSADRGIGKVSLVGAGMKTHPGVAADMFDALADAGINIEIISTSSIRISCVVRAADVERAVEVVHDRFRLTDEAVAPESERTRTR
jgi:aspartate kinase